MLIGRFGMMIPALALGGVLAAKHPVPAGAGTFRTDSPLFVACSSASSSLSVA
jgi:potassium-transporting ATPase potassium-binding subunit